jgi:hypothetical protein
MATPEKIVQGDWGRARQKLVASPLETNTQFPREANLAGSTVKTDQGAYTMQGASAGGVPIRQGVQVPPLQPRQAPTGATPENPLVVKGQTVPLPTQDARQREIDIMVKKAKDETLNDQDLRFLAERAIRQRDVPAVQPVAQPVAQPTGQPGITDIMNMTPEERLAYQQRGFQDMANQQLGSMDEFAQQQQDVYNKRIADVQAQIEAEKAKGESGNNELLKAFEAEQRAVADESKQDVTEAGAEGMDRLQRLAARRGMSRSSSTEKALVNASENTQKLVADIERQTNQSIREYQVQLLDKLDQKIGKLEDRVYNLGDQAAQAEISTLKDKQTLYMNLMTQSPSNPAKMVEIADALKKQQLEELKEQNQAAKDLRADAQKNFQFMISSFGSQAFANTSPEEMENLAVNLGIPVSTLLNMPATLKEQENEWDKLKYFDSQDFQMNLRQMDYAQQNMRDSMLFDQDIAKLQVKLANDMSLEDFKSELDQAKSQKERQSVLSALGLKYNEYADSGDKSALNFSVPVPHPAGAGEVVSLNAKLAQAYPDGFRFKASDGPGGLGGQCKWFAQQLTQFADGSGWLGGSTLTDTKKNFEKYYKQGKAFKVGEQEVKPGMAVLSSDSQTYGHGYVINAIRPDGKWVVTESNYKGPLTVSNSRVVDPNDPKVIGVLKTVPKKAFTLTGLKKLGEGIGKLIEQTPLQNVLNAAGKFTQTNVGNEINRRVDQEYQDQYNAANQPIEITDEQVKIFNSLSDADKRVVMEEAPAIYSQLVRRSEKKDARPLDMSVTSTLAKFNDVSTQLDAIDQQYKKLSNPDPITGEIRIRNPYDKDVQQLNRMITAVVPSLARGVFGEVGVLTDSDVERYTKLLADARTPKDQAEEAMSFLKNRVKGSYNNYLDTFGRAGYDISQFAKFEDGLPDTQFNRDVSVLRRQGSSDQEVVNAIANSREYSEFVKQAKLGGASDSDIINYLSRQA